ncbi:MAG TPA: S9 family peptidase [Polyangiaceae bacterium]|jgi:oligopeptidase B
MTRFPTVCSVLALALASACASPAPPPPPSPRTPLFADVAAHLDAGAAPSTPAPLAAPPIAHKEPHETTLNGRKLEDDYAWLRKKDSPEVVSYLEAENAYTKAMTAGLEPLETRLYDEAVARIEETDSTPPAPYRGWLYYSRTEKGKQYPIYCRKKAAAGAPEVVLLDPNEIGKTHPFVGVGDKDVSDDGNLYAYALDTTGFRENALHVKDLRTDRELPDHAERVDSVAFAADGKTVFYVTEDAQTKRPNQLHRHVLGTDAAKDPLVYDEKDERFSLYVWRARSGDFVVLHSSSHTADEARLFDAHHPERAAVVVEPRSTDHQYTVDPGKTALFIRTNSGGRNFRLVSAPLATPGRAHWKEMIPQRADVMLESVDAFSDHVVVQERKDAKVAWRSIDLKTQNARAIGVDEQVYRADEEPNRDFVTDRYRFGYSTPAAPHLVYEEDVHTGARTLVKRDVAPSVDPARYVAERTHITARDGTEIPVSLVYAKGLTPDGTHPLYLYGYGAYGLPSDVGFDPMRLSLVDRGVVCAIAHIRGGGDLGKPWHDAGRMANKKNTFTDFIDAAEGLIKAGWAKRGDIGIEGRSAGGLLMGAVTNMRPDLWRVVLAGVPFVDVMNTMLDESIPLTVEEFEEWGNPKIPEQFGWMVAYSPYDNVEKKDYPAMLVESSYNDSQVMYWEPAKWVARLRATKTDANPLYFHVNMQPAGHGGQSGRYDRLRERALRNAFLLTELGAAHANGSSGELGH